MKKQSKPLKESVLPDLNEIAENYNEFPKEFLKALKGSLVFIQAHGNADSALAGLGVLARVSLESIARKSVMVVKSPKPLPEGHVFLGLPRLKALGNAYVHSSQDGKIIIGSMSSRLIK